MTTPLGPTASQAFPPWVPEAARNYIVHTEAGLSIRALARAGNCHPSTVLRQVRRFEGRRDDPLVDSALRMLSTHMVARSLAKERETKRMNVECFKSETARPVSLTQDEIDQDAKRILRRLCEQGALLAIAAEMETAVVVRLTDAGEQVRTALVDRQIAQAMALKDWITCPEPDSRIARYFITNAGRAALRRLTAQDENRASGFAERHTDPDDDAAWDIAAIEGITRPQHRHIATESPLIGLSRRKDRSGQPFLPRDLVAAGERLREDYELVEVGMSGFDGWEGLTRGQDPLPLPNAPKAALDALNRIKDALADLGPGLGDVVLRCCCFLEGLEHTEKAMGWSARSGKIVLRIALQRLKRHYDDTQGRFGPMIG